MTEHAPPIKDLKYTTNFVWQMGLFNVAWSEVDLLLSFAIGQFLAITHQETHILTSGMEFGRKASLLRNLAYRSEHPRRTDIIGAIGRLQNDSKRNVFSHGYMISDSSSVTFIDRSRGGDFKVTAYTFTMQEWNDHVGKLFGDSFDLSDALGFSLDQLHGFALSALDMNTKPERIP